MKLSPANLPSARMNMRTAQHARAGIVLLVLVCLLLGLGAGVYWHRQAAKPGDADQAGSGQQLIEFSEVMKADLQRLDSPVEIRFYTPSGRSTLPEPLQAFAGRVDQLLAWYAQEAGGKIHVTRLDPLTSPGAEANARADGIKPLPLATGDYYYLGLALVYHDQKELLTPLVPEWEPALPSDLSRAILRLTASKAAAQRAASSSTADPAAAKETLQEVVRAIPDAAAVSLADGSQILRKTALEQFKAAVSEMQARLAAAQQKLAAAQGGTSEADQQAALKEFQQVQMEQTEKLRQITQRLQDQIAALEQLKKAAH